MMLICTACNLVKPLADFSRNRTTRGYQYKCKLCYRLWQVNHVSAVYKAAKRQKERQRSKLITFKQNRPCVDCKGIFPHYVMDFDHIEGSKKFNVSVGKHRYPWKVVMEEIAKCELVCANCHRIRTYNRQANVL